MFLGASRVLVMVFFFLLIRRPLGFLLFPYTTLFRSRRRSPCSPCSRSWAACGCTAGSVGDRKSTRLNSSHVEISYADFRLKKNILHCDNILKPPAQTQSQLR